eukprot:1819443-Prymnesium_polylepis.1
MSRPPKRSGLRSRRAEVSAETMSPTYATLRNRTGLPPCSRLNALSDTFRVCNSSSGAVALECWCSLAKVLRYALMAFGTAHCMAGALPPMMRARGTPPADSECSDWAIRTSTIGGVSGWAKSNVARSISVSWMAAASELLA